jgi:hypothetical protein
MSSGQNQGNHRSRIRRVAGDASAIATPSTSSSWIAEAPAPVRQRWKTTDLGGDQASAQIGCQQADTVKVRGMICGVRSQNPPQEIPRTRATRPEERARPHQITK